MRAVNNRGWYAASGGTALMPNRTDSDTDFLDELIEERAAMNPAFTAMMEEAYQRRWLLRLLAARKAAHLTRTVVAARMGTSEAAVARGEAATGDRRASTIERFAAAIGKGIYGEIVDVHS